MALQSRTRLGPYDITAQIGVGGMGEVYRAPDTKLDRDVAIKVLPEWLAGREQSTEITATKANTGLMKNETWKPSTLGVVAVAVVALLGVGTARQILRRGFRLRRWKEITLCIFNAKTYQMLFDDL